MTMMLPVSRRQKLIIVECIQPCQLRVYRMKALPMYAKWDIKKVYCYIHNANIVLHGITF